MGIRIQDCKSRFRKLSGILKIYHKDATREHMLENLKAILNLEKTVTFGSIQECYDVFIEDSDRNLMVREMKKRYKPICLKHV